MRSGVVGAMQSVSTLEPTQAQVSAIPCSRIPDSDRAMALDNQAGTTGLSRYVRYQRPVQTLTATAVP
eukprot:255262-Chlamydomonas_euryale.AAC.1